MTHLILLEDDPVLREELTEFFASMGYRVSSVGTLADFRASFTPDDHCIAIIDLGLPDGNGLDLITELRAAGHRLGIIVLTAHGAVRNKIAVLKGGADHYLSKTGELQELAATVAALARRLDVQLTPRWKLMGSPRQLFPPGFEPIPLSGQDYAVLLALATGGECVTRESICRALGADYFQYDQRRLDTQMRRLRRKVKEACGLDLPVTTLRCIGFRFHDDIDVLR
jgi:DNA-binding response OmpR family regulator